MGNADWEKEEYTTARLSRAVRLYLEENSLAYRRKFKIKTRESVDNILRRIFKIDEKKGDKK